MSAALASVGRSLSQFVDDALANDSNSADWSIAAGALQPAAPALIGDPFARLFHSPFGSRAYSMIGNEGQTLAAVGHYAADVVCTLLQFLPKHRQLPFALSKDAKVLVVFHGEKSRRRSILVLDPSLDPDTPERVVPSPWIADVLLNTWGAAANLAVPTFLPMQSTEDTMQALWIARPRVVIAPAPKLEYTCVKQPPGEIVSGLQPSTAGAYARDANGSAGVTVCYHGTGPAGTALTIDGVPRTVTAASQTLDTSFVAIPDADLPPAAALVARRGLLTSRAPGNMEAHRFWSAGETKHAYSTASDFGVPNATPQRQLCVYTDAVTNYGDSGGALVNEDDQLVGFSFQRTPFGSRIEFSTWIWAASAFSELGLKPL